jgi:hypothetical protein
LSLPSTKALFIPAVFAIGVVILAVDFFFAPDTYNLDTLIKAVWSKTSGDSNTDRIREAERKAAADAKSEADRIAAENAAKTEADRIAKENAANAEADRISLRQKQTASRRRMPPRRTQTASRRRMPPPNRHRPRQTHPIPS